MKFAEISDEGLAWIASRPPEIQAMIRKHPPNLLYRMKSSGHRVTIYSYAEDGTVTVDVTGQYNVVTFSRRVFGVKPDDLTECDGPALGEPTGDLAAEAGVNEKETTRFARNMIGIMCTCGGQPCTCGATEKYRAERDGEEATQGAD
jgi:hypothetical protein